MAESTSHPVPPPEVRKPVRMFRKLDPSEIPPELADDELLQWLTTLTPEEERAFEKAAELDALDP